MSSATQENEGEKARIMLGLLESVERDGGQSQRRLASELGIALGLVNAYLKRCIKKGLVKVSEAPARRYAYYLTPQGFAEKSRLTVDYLSYSFSFFRSARADCAEIFLAARGAGVNRVAIAGISDLAEIARICALESGVEIAAVVDANARTETYLGVPVVPDFLSMPGTIDAIVVTDMRTAQATYDSAAATLGAPRVFAPRLLGIRQNGTSGAAA